MRQSSLCKCKRSRPAEVWFVSQSGYKWKKWRSNQLNFFWSWGNVDQTYLWRCSCAWQPQTILIKDKLVINTWSLDYIGQGGGQGQVKDKLYFFCIIMSKHLVSIKKYYLCHQNWDELKEEKSGTWPKWKVRPCLLMLGLHVVHV